MLRLRRSRFAEGKTRIGKFGIVQTDCNRGINESVDLLWFDRLLAFFGSRPTTQITNQRSLDIDWFYGIGSKFRWLVWLLSSSHWLVVIRWLFDRVFFFFIRSSPDWGFAMTVSLALSKYVCGGDWFGAFHNKQAMKAMEVCIFRSPTTTTTT